MNSNMHCPTSMILCTICDDQSDPIKAVLTHLAYSVFSFRRTVRYNRICTGQPLLQFIHLKRVRPRQSNWQLSFIVILYFKKTRKIGSGRYSDPRDMRVYSVHMYIWHRICLYDTWKLRYILPINIAPWKTLSCIANILDIFSNYTCCACHHARQ